MIWKATSSPFGNRRLVPFLALTAVALWGSAATFIKLGYAELSVSSADTASQLLFAGCRFTLAGILALIIFSVAERKPLYPGSKLSFGRIGALAFTQTLLQYLCFYVGVAHTSGTNSAILNGCNPFITILATVFIFRREKMDRYKAFGCLLGFAAVMLMNYSGLQQGLHFSFLGEGVLLLSLVGNITSTILAKRYSAFDDPVMLSGYQFTLGGVILILVGLAFGGKLIFTAGAVLILLWLAMVSAIAYSFWSLLLKYNDISRIAIYNSANPLFGVIFAAVFLGETKQAFHPLTLFSLALVCLGICVVNRFGKGLKNS